MQHIPKNHITQDVRPSNCCAKAYVVLSQNIWRAFVDMNWIESHRRVDQGVAIGDCRMNRLLFADELVLHAWIFSTGSSARISTYFLLRATKQERKSALKH